MNSKISKFYILVLVCIVFSCKKNKAELTDSEKQKINIEILEMFNNYHTDIKNKGLKAEFDYLDDSSDFYWVPPGYTSTLSIDSVKSILSENSNSIKSIEFSFESIQVFPLNQTIATYSGIVKGRMVDTLNLESTFQIIESGTLIKRQDRWKLLSGQSRNLE